jgi:glycogen operon protein
MSEEDWGAGFAKSLGVFLNGEAIPSTDERGERVLDETFYVMFDSHNETVTFKLPEEKWGRRWTEMLNTCETADQMSEDHIGHELDAGAEIAVEGWSTLLLRRLE